MRVQVLVMREKVGTVMVITDSMTRPPRWSRDHSVHVIVAEDNAITRRTIELALIGLGWTFDSTADGMAALSAVERAAQNLGLVIADIRMPKMTGIELVKAVKAIPSVALVPVVLMGSLQQESEARAAGCDAFLAKPFSIPELMDRLESVA